MVEAGMSAHDAILSATAQTADLLNIDTELGSISEGKLADIIAVASDLLQDVSVLESVAFVMKDGQVYTRQDRRLRRLPAKHWAESPHMLAGIGAASFAESTVVPIPIETVLIPVSQLPDKMQIAAVATGIFRRASRLCHRVMGLCLT